jgi:N-ethylmaleimide reductase
MSSQLFTPFQAGDLALKSRLVMAPLTRNRAPGQMPTALMAEYYAQRANPATGAGLLITEATPVSAEGHGYGDTPGIHTAEQTAAWRMTTDAVHAQGGVIVCQLWHVGRISHTSLQPGGAAPLAPSAVRANTKTVLFENGAPIYAPTSEPRALEAAEIEAVIEQFAQGARNAVTAGFDGVEIHGANGYLVDQFLRSNSNLRADEWGGGIDKRCRFLWRVCEAVCKAIGAGKVGLRLSPVTPSNDAREEAPQPLFELAVRGLAEKPETRGMAYLHIVEGATGGDRAHNQGAAPFDYAALKAAWRGAGATGAWMLNNGYDAALTEQSLTEGADLIAWGPFISNPDLGHRLKNGIPLTPPDRATFYGGGAKGYTDYPFAA